MNGHPDTETLSAFLDGEASEVIGFVDVASQGTGAIGNAIQERTAEKVAGKVERKVGEVKKVFEK